MKITRREALAAGAAFVASPLAIARGDAQPELQPETEFLEPEFRPEDYGSNSSFPYKRHGFKWRSEAMANIFTNVMEGIHQMPYIENLRRIEIFDDSPQTCPLSGSKETGHLHVPHSGLLSWTDIAHVGHAKPTAVAVFDYGGNPQVTVENNPASLFAHHLKLVYQGNESIYRSTAASIYDWPPALIYRHKDKKEWCSCCWMVMEHSELPTYTVVPITSWRARELYHCSPNEVTVCFTHHPSVAYAQCVGSNREADKWQKKS